MWWRARVLSRSLFSTYPVVLGLGFPSAFLYFAASRCLGESAYRYGGLGLQLAGLVTVVIGISKTRAEFDAGWYRAFARWVGTLAIALGLRKHSPSIGAMTGMAPAPTMHGEATVGLPPGATPEQRIALHDRLIEGLRSRIQATDVAVEEERHERARAIEAERAARQHSDNQAIDLIRRVSMGGVDVSLLGTFWLGFGIVFATVPVELMNLMRSNQ